MPVRTEYTPEFKDQAVRCVLEEVEPDESRKHACERLAPMLSVKAVTLRQWCSGLRPLLSASGSGLSFRFGLRRLSVAGRLGGCEQF